MALPQFSAEYRDRLRKKAQEVQDRLAGSTFERWKWDLTGKQAIVAPGKSIITRLLPRWDYPQRFQNVNGKAVPNPQYQEDDIYFEAHAHWYDGPKGRVHDWCPKGFKEACPICEAASVLLASPNDEDRRKGNDVKAKPEYLFNALMGQRGKRMLDEKTGKLLVRALPAGQTIFSEILQFMVGTGDATSPGYGDVSDIHHGLDFVLTRPLAGGGGDRWKLTLLPPGQESEAWAASEAEAAKQWWRSLINFPEKVKSELRTYEQLYASYYGTDETTGEAASEVRQDAAADDVVAADAASNGLGAAEASDFDPMDAMLDLPDPTEASAPSPRPSAPARSAPPSARPPARPPAARGGKR